MHKLFRQNKDDQLSQQWITILIMTSKRQSPGLSNLHHKSTQIWQSLPEVWCWNATVPSYLCNVLIEQKHTILEMQLLPLFSPGV